MQPLNIHFLDFKEIRSRQEGKLLSLAALLSENFQLEQMRISYEILLPGHQASAPHYHTKIEEMIFIYEGLVDLWLAGQWKQLKPGDIMAFKPQPDHAHMLINQSEQPVKFLSIASSLAGDQIIYLDF